MSKSLVYKVSISDGKKELYSSELSFNEIQDLISSADDNLANEKLFEIAATHPSEVVRENVAYKDNINQETWEILSEDTSVNVLRRLVNSDSCKRNASQKQLEAWIKLDVEIAKNIAGYLDRYEEADIDQLAKVLSEHSDPSVVSEVASNSDTPKKLLKLLLKHKDQRVVSNAKRSLE
ncbi:Mg/Co/Ni transporter MgtE [Polynucleobacter sphagniphilus]|jgi:Mg/Co/Ni transporter MgtE|uniref:hypothetical protein n=1 Tax=Polynucleobacter sphagniphilus TaxID=1743169 RepID=UPI0024761A1A|nr:hypothetical protein [Polynucleobacter sphagniphilus]MDH6302637.1 Mg/Co/Ni transporter MgtE [Polynucleobacter sphagniphilus]